MKPGYAIGFTIVGIFLLICIYKANRSQRIGYLLCACRVYYFAAVYAPRDLIRQSLSMVIEGPDDAILRRNICKKRLTGGKICIQF